MEGKKLLDLYTILKGKKQPERSPADLSRTGADLIKGEEAFVPHLYDDLDNRRRLTKEDIINKNYKGTPTIGYGTTFKDEELLNGRQDIDIYGEIDRQTANRLFKEHPVMRDTKRLIDNRLSKEIRDSLTQEQEDALYSFGYNAGAGALNKIINTWNKEGLDAAVNRLKLYNKSKGKTLKGLIKRRNQEAEYLMKNKKYADGGLADLYRADRSVIQTEPEIVAQDDVKLTEDLIRMLDEAQMSEPLMDGSDVAFQDEKVNPSDTPMSPEMANEMQRLAESENKPVQEPSRSIASTKEQAQSKKLSPIESLLEEYKKLKGEYKDSKSQADLLSALSSVASTFDKYSPTSVGLQPMKVTPTAEKPELKEMVDMAKLKGLYKDPSKKRQLSNDPASEDSKKAREQFEAILGYKIPETVSEAMIDKFGKDKAQKEIRQTSNEGVQTRFEDKLSQTRLDKINDLASKYETDSIVNQFKKEGVALDQVQRLLDNLKGGNKVALGALGTKMARAMGEVGVLTDSDVQRYIQRMDIKGKIEDNLARYLSGELTPETSQDISNINKALLKAMDVKLKGQKEKYLTRAYNTYGKKLNMSEQEVADVMGFGEQLSLDGSSEAKSDSYDQDTEIKIQRVMNNNPGASREEVIKQLREAGKL